MCVSVRQGGTRGGCAVRNKPHLAADVLAQAFGELTLPNSTQLLIDASPATTVTLLMKERRGT